MIKAYVVILAAALSIGCTSIRLPDMPWKGKKESETPAPSIPPVNDPSRPPDDWRELQGAPKQLAPGVSWKAIWKQAENPPPAGVWRFEYRTGTPTLYKPETRLWLLDRKNPLNGYRLDPNHIGRCGEFRDRDGTQLVKWHRWPDKTGQSNRLIDGSNIVTDPDNPRYYHGGIVIRDARATASGHWLICWDIYGQRLFEMQIVDREVVQR